MRPDQDSDHDEDEEEAGTARRQPEFNLPIYDPEDADADPEADGFDDIDDDDDDDDDETKTEAVLDDDLLAQEIEAEPRTVLITGACGNIGRKLRAAWTDVYDLVLIDKDAGDDDPEIIEADLAILDDDWITHFHGVDTVVHLAANPDDSPPGKISSARISMRWPTCSTPRPWPGSSGSSSPAPTTSWGDTRISTMRRSPWTWSPCRTALTA